MSAFLASIDPPLLYAAIAALTGAIIYGWRKVSLSSWEAVTRGNPMLEKLPALVLAGLLSTAPALNKSFWPALANIVLGALLGGGTASFGHRLLKDSPLPYTGGARPLFPPGPVPTSELPTPHSMPVISRGP